MNPALLSELAAVVGKDAVLSQPGDLTLYSYDSALDRALPSAVVIPSNAEQVAAVVRILVKQRQPYVARGAATSLCGGPVPLQGAVVIALAKLTRMGKVDPVRREITVEPGVINLRLQEAASAAGLFYPPDPGSQKACTIGGNVATNAGGPHCLKYGVTSQFVLGVDLVLPDGLPLQLKIDDPGYDLAGFFVGSEGTLGITTRVRLKLLPKPKFIQTMLVSFSSIEEAIQSVTDIIAAGILPATLEAMDRTIVEAVEAFSHAGYPLEAEAVLLIEVDGDISAALEEQAGKIKAICEKNHSFDFRVADSEVARAKLWEGRRGSYAAMARLAPNVLVEDGAVPRTKLPEALKRIKEIADHAGLRVALLFHAGDGNLHPQIIFDERNAAETAKVKKAGYEMLKACVDLGGTISGEHGIGIDKREAMKWLFTRETLQIFRRLKNAFDPENFCNPEKLIPLIGKGAEGVTDSQDGAGMSDETMSTSSAPNDEKQMIGLVRGLTKSKTFFGVQGLGTKFRVWENLSIHTQNLNHVLDFDKSNLTVTVQSGAKVEELRAFCEKEQRYLWIAGGGSVGGTIATRASVVPPIRDLILAMRVLLSNGDVVSFGAKTMKNVAGYDAAKLLIGSWGTLGIILDVTFRLFPYPAQELKTETPRRFILRPIHQKIKKAFDSVGMLSPRTTNFTLEDIQKKGSDFIGEPLPDMKKFEDKLWM